MTKCLPKSQRSYAAGMMIVMLYLSQSANASFLNLTSPCIVQGQNAISNNGGNCASNNLFNTNYKDTQVGYINGGGLNVSPTFWAGTSFGSGSFDRWSFNADTDNSFEVRAYGFENGAQDRHNQVTIGMYDMQWDDPNAAIDSISLNGLGFGFDFDLVELGGAGTDVVDINFGLDWFELSFDPYTVYAGSSALQKSMNVQLNMRTGNPPNPAPEPGAFLLFFIACLAGTLRSNRT